MILPTIKLKVYTFWGLMNSATKIKVWGFRALGFKFEAFRVLVWTAVSSCMGAQRMSGALGPTL